MPDRFGAAARAPGLEPTPSRRGWATRKVVEVDRVHGMSRLVFCSPSKFHSPGTLGELRLFRLHYSMSHGGSTMATVVAEREPIVADETEHLALDEIERALVQPTPESRALIVGPDGTRTELPESLYAVLVRAAHELRRGRGISILPVGLKLTTQQAADLVNVSRPFLF